MATDEGTAHPRNPVLDELAAALGIPTTAFFATLDEGDRIAESLTLLRLWATLDQPGQRRELLDHLRRMIDGPPPG